MLRRTPVIVLAVLLLAGCAGQTPGPLKVEVPDAEVVEESSSGGFFTELLSAMAPAGTWNLIVTRSPVLG